jgi:hypothetical protein
MKIPPMRRYTKPCRFKDRDGNSCHGKAKAHGLCTGHLDQLDRGKELTPLLGRHGRKHDGCTFPGCDKPHQHGGLCTGHNTQLRRGQSLRPLGPWGRAANPEGRWVDPKGYVYIKCPVENHPNAKSKRGWIAEHVWVMTEMLGRPLRQGESVHHRNLLKGDNRPENLELWTSHQPRGTSVADMLAWCWWFIDQYSYAPEWAAFPGGPLSENGAESAVDQDRRLYPAEHTGQSTDTEVRSESGLW